MHTPAALRALTNPLYEAFYGLKEQPFAISTDPRFFYLSDATSGPYTELFNGLKRREGLMLVTGETGTGKTTLCRAVTQALHERIFTAIVPNPYLSGADMLRLVLRDFGLVSHEDLRRGTLGAATVSQMLDTLEGFLRALVPLGAYAVIVLDEAQALEPPVLDQMRLLTAIEHDGQRLIQVILCGQPGLLDTLERESLTGLNDRITRRVRVMPLPPGEVPAYIRHRLDVAGGRETVRFDDGAMQVVADLSRGLPRRINLLCDRALQEGRIEGASLITADVVTRAARALAGITEAAPASAPSVSPDGRTSGPAPSTGTSRVEGTVAAPAPAKSIVTAASTASMPEPQQSDAESGARAAQPQPLSGDSVPTASVAAAPAATPAPRPDDEAPSPVVPRQSPATRGGLLALEPDSRQFEASLIDALHEDDARAVDAPPRRRHWLLLVALCIGIAAGYTYYASRVVTPNGISIVRVPTPQKRLGTPLVAHPVPEAEVMPEVDGLATPSLLPPPADAASGATPAQPAPVRPADNPTGLSSGR